MQTQPQQETTHTIIATTTNTITQQQQQTITNEATKRGWQHTQTTITTTTHTPNSHNTNTKTEHDLQIPALTQTYALEKALRLLKHNGIHNITKIEII
jgi:hypothetical protein